MMFAMSMGLTPPSGSKMGPVLTCLPGIFGCGDTSKRITEEMAMISQKMVREAVYSTKKWDMNLVNCKGEAFNNRKKRAGDW